MNRRRFMKVLGVLAPLLSFFGWTKTAKASEPNIIELADSGAFGKLKLFPAQRFVLKMMYRLPLDAQERLYLERLDREGRYTAPFSGSHETVLIMGRRSGMTWLGQVIQMYEALKLLQTPENPKVREGTLSLFYDRESTGLGFGTLASFLVDSSLRPHMKNNTLSYITFENAKGKKVRMSLKSSHARGLRGIRPSSVVLDNAAYHQDLKGTLDAMRPCRGRITVLATSDGSTKFADFCRDADRSGALVLRIPTWEANPLVPTSFYESQREQLGERAFALQYGAEV